MKQRLKVGILDLVAKAPSPSAWFRVMNANFAAIMPQVLAVWCEELGHEVRYVCYTGFEDLDQEFAGDLDILFIGAFSEAAQAAYALSALFRARGVVTVLGGPHARCYPDDARRFFDYVLGFTDKELVRRVLEEAVPRKTLGEHWSSAGHPKELPGIQSRWKFISRTLAKSPSPLKIIPAIGSLGCPYSCGFCIDSTVAFQALDFDQMREDLSFLRKNTAHPVVGWHDPNFGVRFDEILGTIHQAAPEGGLRFIAESSLSMLSESHVDRLAGAGFKALLPGIESWFGLDAKSKSTGLQGEAKVRKVSDHVNMILRRVPYLQANFVLGLDGDSGEEPFRLTKMFLDRTPGAFPAYSLLSAFGEAAPANLEYQRENRVLPFPFHFLDNNKAMNIRPRHYSWTEFYDRVIDLTAYSFSPRRLYRRWLATPLFTSRWINLLRGLSAEGPGRLRFYRKVRRLLDEDRPFRAFFEGETRTLPTFFMDLMRKDLGPLWKHLPPGALEHDPNAYLKKTTVGIAPA